MWKLEKTIFSAPGASLRRCSVKNGTEQEPDLQLRCLTPEEIRKALVKEAAELEAVFQELDRIRRGVTQRFLEETVIDV